MPLALIVGATAAGCATAGGASHPPDPRVASLLETACENTAEERDTTHVFGESDADERASVVPRPPVRVSPPRELRERRAPQLAILSFIVDTVGHVEPCSVRVVRTTDDRWTSFALEELATTDFVPACRAGERVRQRISHPFRLEFR
jgi:hypothetical protein